MTNYKTLALAALFGVLIAQSPAFAQADDDDDGISRLHGARENRLE